MKILVCGSAVKIYEPRTDKIIRVNRGILEGKTDIWITGSKKIFNRYKHLPHNIHLKTSKLSQPSFCKFPLTGTIAVKYAIDTFINEEIKVIGMPCFIGGNPRKKGMSEFSCELKWLSNKISFVDYVEKHEPEKDRKYLQDLHDKGIIYWYESSSI